MSGFRVKILLASIQADLLRQGHRSWSSSPTTPATLGQPASREIEVRHWLLRTRLRGTPSRISWRTCVADQPSDHERDASQIKVDGFARPQPCTPHVLA